MTSLSVGKIAQLMRYPVKSMKGEELKEVSVSYSGLLGDRVFAFKNEDARKEFPWLTAREWHDLLLWKPVYRNSPEIQNQYPRVSDFDLVVHSPTGEQYPINDIALVEKISSLSKKNVTLRFSEKGMQDARPLSLLSVDTISTISKEVNIDLDPLRFRANIYVEWDDKEPFWENKLIGKIIRIGDKLELFVSKKDPRCVIVNIDPDTGNMQHSILRNIAQKHDNCLGVYCVVLREGIIKPGDSIFLI